MRLSVRQSVAVVEFIGVGQFHTNVWNWTHNLAKAQADPPRARPSSVVVNEKQITVDGEKEWPYAAIDTDAKLLLDMIGFYPRKIATLKQSRFIDHLAI